jgi:hypothetical protein
MRSERPGMADERQHKATPALPPHASETVRENRG